MKRLYVLVACEESQAEVMAFRALGHYAYSCDLQQCSKFGCPDWHIVGDVRPYLHGKKSFYVQSGLQKKVPRWDLIISHPPCTYLCRLSAVHMVKNGEIVKERYEKMCAARDFFFDCLNAEAPFVVVENPQPMQLAELPNPHCVASPHWFGSQFSKKTYYWLKNLPPLMAEKTMADPKELVASRRGKYRSRTEPQLACALARQWSEHIIWQNKLNQSVK